MKIASLGGKARPADVRLRLDIRAKRSEGRGSIAGHPGGSTGFTLSELLVVMAVIGVMMATGMPWVLSALPGAQVAWEAREIQGGLSRAKMLAVSTRQNICVQVVATGYQFLQGGCAGAAWTGPGTDATGTLHPAPSITLTNSGTSPIFTPFGTASQAGQLKVTASGGASQTITVAASGRITVP